MQKFSTQLMLLLSLILLSLIVHNCKDDDESGMNISGLEKISNLAVLDVANNGNGLDLQVSFSIPADESNVNAYRVFVVNSSESSGFNLASAEAVSASNYFAVAKTGSAISTVLSNNAKTTSGEIISNGNPYKVFVMTVTNDPTLNLNALSTASPEITLSVSGGNPGDLDKVTNLNIADIGNAGNGADCEVSFSKVADESNVKEYQIFVVNSAESADFDLATAEAVSADNVFIAAKNGSDFSSTLNEDSKTTSGALIANDTPYKIFVMTVTDDPLLNSNALSDPSDEFMLSAEEQVIVTYIANDGIMIEYDGKKVMIDGMNRASNLSGWVTPTNAEYMAVENGDPPFDDIDILMITHNHGDHYSVSAVQNYLSNHPETKLIVPTSIESNFAAYASQIPDFTVEKFERINLVENGISVDVLHIEHFDQFGNDFSTVESFAYIVTMNGKKFLHAGDIDYVDSQLDVFNILADDITVVFIPTFGNLVNAANRDALISNVDPDNVVCLHFLVNSMATTLNQIENIYPGAETFTVPFLTLAY